MKKLLLMLSILTISGSLWASTVATVNGHAIDSSELGLDKNASAQVKDDAIKIAILNQLVIEEAKKENLQKDPDYIKFTESTKKLDKQQRIEANDEALTLLYAQNYIKKHPITDKAINERYEQMKEFFKDSKEADVIAIANRDKATIDKAYAELKQGKKFSDMVKKYTIDTKDKISGGSPIQLQLKTVQMKNPDLYKEITTMKPGQFTSPAQIVSGVYMIFQLKGIHSSKIPSLNELKPMIKLSLEQEAIQASVFDLLKKAKVTPAKYAYQGS